MRIERRNWVFYIGRLLWWPPPENFGFFYGFGRIADSKEGEIVWRHYGVVRFHWPIKLVRINGRFAAFRLRGRIYIFRPV